MRDQFVVDDACPTAARSKWCSGITEGTAAVKAEGTFYGAGAGVAEMLANQGRHTPIVHYGLPDRLIQHGTREEMLADAGLTKGGLLEYPPARQRTGEGQHPKPNSPVSA